jgi:hypothetical protein
VPIPIVSVSGHHEIPGVTNIALNHKRAATLALEYLRSLGHRKVAFIKGQAFRSDTEARWEAVQHAAQELELEFGTRLAGQLEGESSSPELGYEVTRKLLAAGELFTALFASTTFPRSAPSAHCGKRAAACRKTFPWWALTSSSGENRAMTFPLSILFIVARSTSI